MTAPKGNANFLDNEIESGKAAHESRTALGFAGTNMSAGHAAGSMGGNAAAGEGSE